MNNELLTTNYENIFIYHNNIKLNVIVHKTILAFIDPRRLPSATVCLARNMR